MRDIADRNGNRVTFTYDACGTPLEILHSGGYRLRLTAENERITGLWVGDVRVRGYGYTDGHLTETTGSSGLPLRFVYDRAGRVTSWIDTNNRWYSYAYDEQDRVIAEGGEGGHYTLRIGYDGVDPDFPGLKLTTLTSPDGAVTRYLIDEAHQVVGEIDAAGAVSRTMYDEAGRTVAETDPLGGTTGFRYDEHGHLTAVIRPDGSEISAVPDAQGNPVRITDPGGAVWRQTFDTAGNRTTLTDPLAATTRYLYDERGLLAVTDPLGDDPGALRRGRAPGRDHRPAGSHDLLPAGRVRPRRGRDGPAGRGDPLRVEPGRQTPAPHRPGWLGAGPGHTTARATAPPPTRSAARRCTSTPTSTCWPPARVRTGSATSSSTTRRCG
ncbi:hypothetical protein SANTM175S_10362 [Streptomyces antimycoticus]